MHPCFQGESAGRLAFQSTPFPQLKSLILYGGSEPNCVDWIDRNGVIFVPFISVEAFLMHRLLLLGLSGLPMWTTAEIQTRSSSQIDCKLSYPFEISQNRCNLPPETWEISEDWLSALEFPLLRYFILTCCALTCASYNSSLLCICMSPESNPLSYHMPGPHARSHGVDITLEKKGPSALFLVSKVFHACS